MTQLDPPAPQHPLDAFDRLLTDDEQALLAAYLPYWRHDEQDGFLQYNKTLFLRVLNALIFTGVLIAGLNVAMLALDRLFGLAIPGEAYGRLDLTLLFVFNTWFFLGGAPRDFAALEAEEAAGGAGGTRRNAETVMPPPGDGPITSTGGATHETARPGHRSHRIRGQSPGGSAPRPAGRGAGRRRRPCPRRY